MRVVDLADQYHLTTADAIDLCVAAGIPVDDAATELTAEQAVSWRHLAEQQREYRAAQAAADAEAQAAKAQQQAARAARAAAAGTALEQAVDIPAGEFGPIPPPPWDSAGNANEADQPEAAPRLRSNVNADIAPGWGVGPADRGAQISPYAAVALALAVISLIFPFVTALLAIVLAAFAKRRIRESDGALTGERLATLAQVVAGIGIAIWLALLGAALYHDYQVAQNEGRPADLQVDSQTVAWNELHPDLCVRVPHADLSVRDWQAVRCDAPHEGEVIATHTIARPAGDAYPGRQSFIPLGQEVCEKDFQSYVGIPYSQSEIELAVVFPTIGNWNGETDRTVACIVYLQDHAYINGSLQGAKR